jgi:uncharacterized protein (TIGR02145 family)
MGLSDDCNFNNCAGQIRLKHKGICPEGWHIPSDAEWTTLVNFVGNDAGTKLKSAIGWNSGNGTDEYDFSALPGGFGNSIGGFGYVGSIGYWWSATEDNASDAYRRYMYNDSSVYRGTYGKSYLYSVRCIKDN